MTKIKPHLGTADFVTWPTPYAIKSPAVLPTPLKEYHVSWRTGVSCKVYQSGVIRPSPGLWLISVPSRTQGYKAQRYRTHVTADSRHPNTKRSIRPPGKLRTAAIHYSSIGSASVLKVEPLTDGWNDEIWATHSTSDPPKETDDPHHFACWVFL